MPGSRWDDLPTRVAASMRTLASRPDRFIYESLGASITRKRPRYVDRWPKRCSCGCSYDREGWERLPCIGIMRDDVEILELRTCPCRSTISVVLARAGRSGE